MVEGHARLIATPKLGRGRACPSTLRVVPLARWGRNV
jgi:hypothetical protein